MSAPTVTNVSLTKKSFKTIVTANVCSIFLLLCFIYLPLNGEGSLDLINSSLHATKISIFLITILHVSCSLFEDKSVKIKPGSSVFKLVSSGFKGFSLCVVFTLAFHILAVLFGASLTESTEETFHFAALLTTTAILPIILHLGFNTETLVRVFVLNSPELGMESVVYITSICSVVGAWLGAFPITLDWDRPWQVWPITCVLGTLGGHVIGLAVSSLHLCRHFYRQHKIKYT